MVVDWVFVLVVGAGCEITIYEAFQGVWSCGSAWCCWWVVSRGQVEGVWEVSVVCKDPESYDVKDEVVEDVALMERVTYVYVVFIKECLEKIVEQVDNLVIKYFIKIFKDV
ncbi:MAG: hypothetical protein NT038_11225 [Euryarchaeota archaeon]|nr:hypothetical protein [Euryarchaeota archaeon]